MIVVNSVTYERQPDGGWWMVIDQTEDGVTWESHTWRKDLPVPLDDLTGTWTDNTGHRRDVTPCDHRPREDVWHVTNPDYAVYQPHHYDGDTIRIWWTLTTHRPATPQQAQGWADLARLNLHTSSTHPTEQP